MRRGAYCFLFSFFFFVSNIRLIGCFGDVDGQPPRQEEWRSFFSLFFAFSFFLSSFQSLWVGICKALRRGWSESVWWDGLGLAIGDWRLAMQREMEMANGKEAKDGTELILTTLYECVLYITVIPLE